MQVTDIESCGGFHEVTQGSDADECPNLSAELQSAQKLRPLQHQFERKLPDKLLIVTLTQALFRLKLFTEELSVTSLPETDNWHWTRYWRFQRIASCYDRDGLNYPDVFFKEHRDFFSTLPPKSILLDLCTGNGAVARCAASFSQLNQKDFHIIAVDRANIDPLTFVPENQLPSGVLEFIGNINVEALPFATGSCHGIVSQYGLEYTNHKRSLSELARILKPQGQAMVVCHAQEGQPVRDAKKEMEHTDLVVDQWNLYELARRALRKAWEWDIQESHDEVDSLPAVHSFAQGLRELDQLKRRTPTPFLESTYGLLRHCFEVRKSFALPEVLNKINDIEIETLAHRGRLLAMINAALSQEDCHSWIAWATARGLQALAPKPFCLEPTRELAGWTLKFLKVAEGAQTRVQNLPSEVGL